MQKARVFGGIGAVVCAWALGAGSASATTIDPNVFTDGIANNGNCTLREAVQAANTNTAVDQCPAGDSGARDTLRLSDGHYTLTTAGQYEEMNQTGDLDITGGGAIRLEGQGVGETFIDANVAEHILDDDAGANLQLADMSLTSNATSQYGGIGYIHAVDFVAERLDTSGGSGQFGGGFYLSGVNSTISQLRAHDSTAVVSSTGFPNVVSYGGGIFISGGTATISDSTFENNDAVANDSKAFGGGLAIDDGADVTIERSTIVGNEARSSTNSGSATRNGGGIYVASATLNLNNSTVANNIANNTGANSVGGGVFNDGGLVGVNGSTFSGNSATFGSAASSSNSGAVTFALSIVKAPNASFICAEAGGGEVNSTGYNVVFPSQVGCLDNSADIQADPGLLSSPSDNGGYTETMQIGRTSPAFNSVPKNACPSVEGKEDQRGAERPGGKGCDSGSYEYTICSSTPVGEGWIFGTPGKDVFKGTGTTDLYAPSAGNDKINAGGGSDIACGGSGKDKLKGGSGVDRLIGGRDKDSCDGGPGTDTLRTCEKKKNA